MTDHPTIAAAIASHAHLIAYPHRSGWYCDARFGDLTIKAQVDTGCWDCVIPKTIAESLGCKVVGTQSTRGVVGPPKPMPVFEGPRLNGVEIEGALGRRVITNFGRMSSTDLDYALLGATFLRHFIVVGCDTAMLLMWRGDQAKPN